VAGLAGAAAAGAALAGCDPFGGGGGSAAPDDHQSAMVDFMNATGALADRYDDTISTVPALAGRLTPIRDAHRAHVKALATALGVAAPASAPPATRSPADGGAALAAVVAAEKTGRDAAVAACLGAVPRLAPLIGSIAAARATHLEVLT
jgi:hypothetical protein